MDPIDVYTEAEARLRDLGEAERAYKAGEIDEAAYNVIENAAYEAACIVWADDDYHNRSEEEKASRWRQKRGDHGT